MHSLASQSQLLPFQLQPAKDVTAYTQNNTKPQQHNQFAIHKHSLSRKEPQLQQSFCCPTSPWFPSIQENLLVQPVQNSVPTKNKE